MIDNQFPDDSLANIGQEDNEMSNNLDSLDSLDFVESGPIKVLLVDDHAVVRQGLRMFLGLDPELLIVGEATNGLEACEMAKLLNPNIILMDLLMPVMDGLTAIQKIKKAHPDIEIIALTSVLPNAPHQITGLRRPKLPEMNP